MVDLVDHSSTLDAIGTGGNRVTDSLAGTAHCPIGHRGCRSLRIPGRGPVRSRTFPIVTDPVLRLETARLSVEPGGQVQTTITVQNAGDIVEGYLLEVLGEDVFAWAQVLPAEVQVYPGQDSTAVLVFNPPSDAAAGSGAFPFAVRARSVVDESVSAVVEGDLDL